MFEKRQISCCVARKKQRSEIVWWSFFATAGELPIRTETQGARRNTQAIDPEGGVAVTGVYRSQGLEKSNGRGIHDNDTCSL